MPINAYTGLMGSGKSFEVVSSVIIQAVRIGRRVVTNVDSIDSEAIRALVEARHGVPMAKLGHVVSVSNEAVERDDFLPHGKEVATVVEPGDLVVIDEAWRFWGTPNRIKTEHAIFFREHRHYVHPDTKVSCDLVVMVQDIADLNLQLKRVVETHVRTTKLKSLGLHKIYRVEVFEGHSRSKRNRISVENKKYDPKIFPLYSSYTGGVGKEVVVDKRQSVFSRGAIWFLIVFVLLMLFGGAYLVRRFFQGPASVTASSDSSRSAAPVVPPVAVIPPPQPGFEFEPAPVVLPPSPDWRIVGQIRRGASLYVLLADPTGRVRVELSDFFTIEHGRVVSGVLEERRVTSWTGQIPGVAGPPPPVGMGPPPRALGAPSNVGMGGAAAGALGGGVGHVGTAAARLVP